MLNGINFIESLKKEIGCDGVDFTAHPSGDFYTMTAYCDFSKAGTEFICSIHIKDAENMNSLNFSYTDGVNHLKNKVSEYIAGKSK